MRIVFGIFFLLAALGIVSGVLDVIQERKSVSITTHQLQSNLYISCTNRGKCLICNDEGDDQLAMMKCGRAVSEL